MNSAELIAFVVPAAVLVAEAGLLGWSWERAIRAPSAGAGTSSRAMRVWLVAIVTLDYAAIAVFRFLLGGEGFFPQADAGQKAVVIGGALVAVGAGAAGLWLRPVRDRIPFLIACLLLAATWSALGYLLFTPLISGPAC